MGDDVDEIERAAEKKALEKLNNIFCKDYKTIRTFVRYSFLSRCCSGRDYEKWTGLSNSNVSKKLVEKLRFMTTNNTITLTRSKDGRKIFGPTGIILGDVGKVVASSYRMAAITASHVILDFALMTFLQAKPANQEALRETIKRKVRENDFVGLDNWEKQVSKQLEQLENFGVIKEKDGAYYPVKNFLANLAPTELEDLYYETQYYLKHALFSVPGYFLLDTIYQKITTQRLAAEDKNLKTIFCFQEDYLYSMAEEDLTAALLQAIEAEAVVSLAYAPANRRQNKGENYLNWFEWDLQDLKVKKVKPLRVIRHEDYGRDYVKAWDIKEKQYFLLRIDRIQAVKNEPNMPCKKKREKQSSQKIVVVLRMETDESMAWLRDKINCLDVAHIYQKDWKLTMEQREFGKIMPYLYACGSHVEILFSSDDRINGWLYDKAKSVLQAYENSAKDKELGNDRASSSINKTIKVKEETLKTPKTLFVSQNNDIYNCVQEAILYGSEVGMVFADAEETPQQKKHNAEIIQQLMQKYVLDHENHEHVAAIYLLAKKAYYYRCEFPPSLMLQQFTLAMLSDDEPKLFLKNETINKILDCLRDENVTPWAQVQVETTRKILSHLAPETVERIRQVGEAIRQKAWLSAEGTIYCPYKIRHYISSGQFYFLGWKIESDQNGGPEVFVENLAELPGLQLIKADASVVDLIEEKLIGGLLAAEPVEIAMRYHEPHVLERSFALFNQYNQEGHIENQDIHRFKLHYFAYEEERLIRDILSLNEYAIVLAPPRIQERIIKEWTAVQARSAAK